LGQILVFAACRRLSAVESGQFHHVNREAVFANSTRGERAAAEASAIKLKLRFLRLLIPLSGLPMRVVLVDPSRTVLKCITRILVARDHEVRPFLDGREALAHIAANEDVDALITSAELITMSGMELCWETRLLAGSRRPIYVIMMSSSRDGHKLIEALDSGADDFIGKPPAAEELYARLRAAERLESMHRELIRLATIDPLTGMFNRRAFFERAEEALSRGDTLSAIMFDIDHFKRVNDVYGHDVGDEAIRGVAHTVAAVAGISGRLGGEEFALLLAGLGLAEAADVAERLRQAVEALRFATPKGEMGLTCSFGVSERKVGDSIDRMLKRADVALYAAKTGGRNRVIAAGATDELPGYDDAGRVVRAGARGARQVVEPAA
jgi:diguanylate cyclase (GGDEF)-like protein